MEICEIINKRAVSSEEHSSGLVQQESGLERRWMCMVDEGIECG